MDSQSLQALESAAKNFLALLKAEAPPLPKRRPQNDYWYGVLSRYEISRTRSRNCPFVMHLGPSYKYLCTNGDMYKYAKGSKVRNGFFGNVFALSTEEAIKRSLEWREQSGNESSGWYSKVPPQECDICRRTKNVRNTVVGYRCQYCRGSDSRHMGLVRRLGYEPIHHGRPITNYLVD